MLGIKEGEIHYFRSRSFCLTLPKIFVGETFCAVFQKISGFDEIYGEEGGVPGFPVGTFLSQSPEEFRRGPRLCSTKFPVSKKFMDKRDGGSFRIFRRYFFVSQGRKISQGKLSMFHRISRIEKTHGEEGVGIRISRRKFFVSWCRKISLGNPSLFHKISGIEKN